MRDSSSFGDVVLSTSFVEALKLKHPNSKIYFLTKSAFEDVFVNNSQINKVFTIKNSNLLDIYKTAVEINKLDITKIFDLSQNFKSRFVSFFIDSDVERISKNSFSRRLIVLFKIFPKRVKSITLHYLGNNIRWQILFTDQLRQEAKDRVRTFLIDTFDLPALKIKPLKKFTHLGKNEGKFQKEKQLNEFLGSREA